MDDDVKTFLEYCSAYMDINALGKDWEAEFVDAIARLRNESDRLAFRRGFAKSILGGLSPIEYENETGWDFDDDEEFRQHLLKYWAIFYGPDNPADSVEIL